MHRLRVVKSGPEIELIKEAGAVTGRAFRRALRFVKPGVNEAEVVIRASDPPGPPSPGVRLADLPRKR